MPSVIQGFLTIFKDFTGLCKISKMYYKLHLGLKYLKYYQIEFLNHLSVAEYTFELGIEILLEFLMEKNTLSSLANGSHC